MCHFSLVQDSGVELGRDNEVGYVIMWILLGNMCTLQHSISAFLSI